MYILVSILNFAFFFGIYLLVLQILSKKQKISFKQAYFSTKLGWRITLGILYGWQFCYYLILNIAGWDVALKSQQFISMISITIGGIIGCGITLLLNKYHKSQDSTSMLPNSTTINENDNPHQIKSLKECFLGINLFWRLVIGIFIGWCFSFMLIWILFGGDSMDEEGFRMISFVSFPMGAIIGGGFVLALNKKSHSKELNTAQQPQGSKYEQLAQLKNLFDAGALTEEEYSAEKTKILNS